MPKIAYQKPSLQGPALEIVRKANAIISRYKAQGYSLTLRQLYYRFVAAGLIPNTQKNYKRLGSIINKARMMGLIDWDAIEDRTRGLASLGTFESPAEMVAGMADAFRIDRWANQPVRVEIWVEKDALSQVARRAGDLLRVPSLVCRGYTSTSEMWRAARRLSRTVKTGQGVVILHLGDHDPSGLDMSGDIRRRLKRFMEHEGTWKGLKFHRVALNQKQIQKFNPPPNPAKQTDSRYRAYAEKHGNYSWELDALEPAALVELIRGYIKHYRDEAQWKVDRARELKGRADLRAVAARWDEAMVAVGRAKPGARVPKFIGPARKVTRAAAPEPCDPAAEEYRCQFCGKETPAANWRNDKCPKCGRKYDSILAQDEETD